MLTSWLLVLAACGGGGAGVENAAPLAVPGAAQSVVASSQVELNASASSDPNGDPISYSWTLTSKPQGSVAVLNSSSSVKAGFVADLAGTYVATLVVSDGKASSAGATVTITATTPNSAPVSNAGTAQNVVAGTVVTLDGSRSNDPNADLLTFRWALTNVPAGSTASLAQPDSAKPTFTADVAGTYVASLIVSDGKVNSAPATVTITAAVANAAPVANAGPGQNAVAGTVVTLDGSQSSDANADPLTYQWNLTSKPAGSIAALANPTSVKPTFTADVPGTYLLSLVVNDGKVNSSASTVTITASAANAAPVANAGLGQNVQVGSVVTLDASGSSDANGDTLTFNWSLTSKPPASVASISSPKVMNPSFTADAAGTYVATLTVNDGKVSSAPATVAVTAADSKRIGQAYLARNGMSVTLTALSITDLGNGYVRYTASYRQQNNSAAAIDEATLRLYFTNASPAAQYGFFGRVLPGAAFAVDRTYSFEVPAASTPWLLQYDADHFFAGEPVPGALQWVFPIR